MQTGSLYVYNEASYNVEVHLNLIRKTHDNYTFFLEAVLKDSAGFIIDMRIKIACE